MFRIYFLCTILILIAEEHLQPVIVKLNPFKVVPFIEDDGFVLSERLVKSAGR